MNAIELPELSLPDLSLLADTVRTAAASLALPGTELLVAAGLGGVAALLALATLVAARGRRRRIRELEFRAEESATRVQGLEVLVADLAAEAALLRQRVGELSSRQDSMASGSARSGLRQAIALSRHGATTRQLIDTCGLSQGEAHLIQTLYGQPAGEPLPEGLH